MLPRERGHEYYVDHAHNTFYIKTNYQAQNFRLMQVNDSATDFQSTHWAEVSPHNPEILLENFEIMQNFIVTEERHAGILKFKVIESTDFNNTYYIAFSEPTYVLALAENLELGTDLLRFTYTSLTTPKSVLEYDLATKTQTLLKQKEVLLGFDKNNYQTERVYATATDGAKIPISLVYRTSLRDPKHGNKTLLKGYGAYGHSIDPYFSEAAVSLLDRGFVIAIAHIRGGEDLGRSWYENGKLFHKMNTFTDYIAVAEHLIAAKYAAPDYLVGMGGSAGGLLMGAVLNMRPDLFKGIVAQVPFVDVITTMLDDTLPLTTGEYDEWGNPAADVAAYRYILSYSPYDNVKPQQYPHLLVTAGLHDSQVPYWEPAKWVAKLRTKQLNPNNKLLLKTEMQAGHGGASGRYQIYKEIAFEYAFVLSLGE
jgi:oligopeptidase B